MEWDHWPNQGYPCYHCGKHYPDHDQSECPTKQAMIDKTKLRSERINELIQRLNSGDRLVAKFNCENCNGTGNVHSHNPECWVCDGRGWYPVEEPRTAAGSLD